MWIDAGVINDRTGRHVGRAKGTGGDTKPFGRNLADLARCRKANQPSFTGSFNRLHAPRYPWDRLQRLAAPADGLCDRDELDADLQQAGCCFFEWSQLGRQLGQGPAKPGERGIGVSRCRRATGEIGNDVDRLLCNVAQGVYGHARHKAWLHAGLCCFSK